MEHGNSAYANRGCRCDICRSAHAAASKEYRQRNIETRRAYERAYMAAHTDKQRHADLAACSFCGREYRPWLSARGIYCSTSCAGQASIKDPSQRLHRRWRHLPAHPLAGKNGKVLAYRVNLYEAIGPGTHPCHWCERTVAWTTRVGRGITTAELAVDHLDGDDHNDAVVNLVPSCNPCNTLRGTIQGWERRTGRQAQELLATRH